MLGLLASGAQLLVAYLSRKEDASVRRGEAQAKFQTAFTQAKHALPGYSWLIAPIVAVSAIYFGSVVIYSIFWCAKCAFPQPWEIARLPSPIDEYLRWVFLYLFGAHLLRKW